jgi:tripartite-type tricarboxylate transporter receptor subunit TctC
VLTPVVPQIKDGKLRGLAVTSKTRSRSLPDVPTMGEAGYPNIEGDSWVGVLVPSGTPRAIIASLHREIVKILALPDMKEQLATLGYDLIASTPEEFAHWALRIGCRGRNSFSPRQHTQFISLRGR